MQQLCIGTGRSAPVYAAPVPLSSWSGESRTGTDCASWARKLYFFSRVITTRYKSLPLIVAIVGLVTSVAAPPAYAGPITVDVRSGGLSESAPTNPFARYPDIVELDTKFDGWSVGTRLHFPSRRFEPLACLEDRPVFVVAIDLQNGFAVLA